MLKKIKILLFIIVLTVQGITNISFAQLDQTNTLQPDLGGSGSSGMGQPSTFEPAPVDGSNNGTLDPSSDPGGPGGDIDDLGAIPLDGGTSILLILGLLGGLVIINARNAQRKENQLNG